MNFSAGQGGAALLLLLASVHLAAPARAEEVPATGSNYGGAGLLEMRNARFRGDGTLDAATALRNQRRFYALSFQALPWAEVTFRLGERLNGTTGTGITTDRAFDLKLRLVEEGDWWPALAVGLQDFIGTGIYSGEYLVASRRFGALDATLGLGWGRLGTEADGKNPLGTFSDSFRRRPRSVDEGGSINTLGFFRGSDVAVFGGLEYELGALPTPFGTLDGLRAKVELSGDALRDERGGYPARTTGLRGGAESRVNYGLQWSNGWLDAGAEWVHGTDFLLRLSARLDPERPPEPQRAPPPPMAPRPAAAAPGAEAAAMEALRAAGFRPVHVRIAGAEARIAVAGGRQRRLSHAAARVLRAVQPHLPREVESVVLSWRQSGTEVARLTLPRATMEAAARGQASAEELFWTSRLDAADADEFGVTDSGSGLSWGLEPRLQTLLGDPRRALRWQLSAVAGARYEIGEGVAVAGSVGRTVAGNLGGAPASDSRLPHVRSDAARYAREGETSIPALYGERIWGLAPDVFARVTGGLLEPMFAGVSTEVLWRPHDAWWGLGVDVARVAQRRYDGGVGMLGYDVTTGHVSAYVDLPWHGMYAVARAGRYLAGDWGGTLELGRRFSSGIEVGGFGTITDVPFKTFGEGSFDRGVYVRIPLDLLGIATRDVANAVIRGVQRDGGQRLQVDSPLWQVTREGRTQSFEDGYRGFIR